MGCGYHPHPTVEGRAMAARFGEKSAFAPRSDVAPGRRNPKGEGASLHHTDERANIIPPALTPRGRAEYKGQAGAAWAATDEASGRQKVCAERSKLFFHPSMPEVGCPEPEAQDNRGKEWATVLIDNVDCSLRALNEESSVANTMMGTSNSLRALCVSSAYRTSGGWDPRET